MVLFYSYKKYLFPPKFTFVNFRLVMVGMEFSHSKERRGREIQNSSSLILHLFLEI